MVDFDPSLRYIKRVAQHSISIMNVEEVKAEVTKTLKKLQTKRGQKAFDFEVRVVPDECDTFEKFKVWFSTPDASTPTTPKSKDS